MSTRSATDGARGFRLFASMVVAVAVLAILSYRGGSDGIAVTGTVVDFRSGESIAIANDQVVTLRLELDRTTRYETADSRGPSDSSAVSLGSQATVWYRSTDERRRVVDRVRVLADTGGLRKVRWAPAGGGKRGGLRVIYYWVPGEQVFYMYAYTKAEQGDLTPAQTRHLSHVVREEFK